MKILHLIPNDEKTIKLICARFSEIEENENRYIVHSSKKVKLAPGCNSREILRIVDSTFFFSSECKKDVLWCDMLIVHYMTPWSAYVLLTAPKNLPIIWSGWGGDYYRLIEQFEGALVLPLTANMQTSSERPVGRSIHPIRLIKAPLRKVLDLTLFKNWEQRILERVDYFSSPIPEDYLLLTKLLPNFKAKYHQLNYGSVETLFLSEPQYVTGEDVLIGNSATPTNNHIEIFQVLREFDLEGRKLIVPLSYGDASYRKEIINVGRSTFGENFQPLTEFMSLAEYDRTISSCSTVLMNHRRQQALGNINTMLYKGAKVFLNADSVVYSFFKKRGAHVYAISDIANNVGGLFQSITEDQINKNRCVLNEFWGHEVVINNIRRLTELTNRTYE